MTDERSLICKATSTGRCTSQCRTDNLAEEVSRSRVNEVPCNIRLLSFALVGALSLASARASEDFASTRTVRVTEQHLRGLIEQSLVPQLSNVTVAPDSRPAVAEISISPQGKVIAISILEAPTLDIAHALKDSLTAWTFKSVKSGNSDYRVGKLSFYFRTVDGRLVVVQPATKK